MALLLSTCLVSGLLLLGISDQSLWIDEGLVARLASHDTLRALFSELNQLTTSDPQMPLYLVFMWVWTMAFGISELALRASNIPFALLLALVFSWAFCRLFRRPWLALLVGLSPFLWYYMNEARPYIPVVALAAVSLVATEAYLVDRRRYGAWATWVCLVSFLVLCATYMLGVFFGVALAVLITLEARRRGIGWRSIVADWKRPIGVHTVLFLPLGAYFLLTLVRGSGGSRGSPGLGNLAFVVFEFLGFAGLGPPRHVLRAHPIPGTLLPYWPWLCLGGLACLGLVFLAARVFHSVERASELASVVAALTAGGVALTAASLVFRFEFWGRHWAPLFPLFVLGIAVVMSTAPGGRRFCVAQLSVLVLLLSAWALSSSRLRLMTAYFKDDYRRAAEIALSEASARGATVVWVADDATAKYYGLEAERGQMPTGWPVRGRGVFAANWERGRVEATVSGRTAPLVVVLSKPDLYDRSGAWSSVIEESGARRLATPNAFEIFVVDQR